MTFRLALAAAVLAVALAGCGRKGPLDPPPGAWAPQEEPEPLTPPPVGTNAPPQTNPDRPVATRGPRRSLPIDVLID